MRGERAAPRRRERRAAFSEATLIFAAALLTRLIYCRLQQMQVHGGRGETVMKCFNVVERRRRVFLQVHQYSILQERNHTAPVAPPPLYCQPALVLAFKVAGVSSWRVTFTQCTRSSVRFLTIPILSFAIDSTRCQPDVGFFIPQDAPRPPVFHRVKAKAFLSLLHGQIQGVVTHNRKIQSTCALLA